MSALVTEVPPELNATVGVLSKDLFTLKVSVTVSSALAKVEVELFDNRDVLLMGGEVVSMKNVGIVKLAELSELSVTVTVSS